MKVFAYDHTVFVDVDNTLILYPTKHEIHNYDLEVRCPYSYELLKFCKHKGHERLLKNCYAQGYAVVVWSAQGFAWCKAVIEAMELEEYVTMCMGKPQIIVDDKDFDKWPIANLYLSGGFGK